MKARNRMNTIPRLISISLLIVIFCSCSATKVETITFKPSKDFVKSAEGMSDQEENVIGRAVSARIFSQYKPITNSELTHYLNEVGQTIVASSQRPETFAGYSFVILETDEINAMSAPGGYIFISRGFLHLLPDEDTLAAVLAHEVMHISKRHGLKAIKPGHSADYLEVGQTLASAVDCAGLSQQLLIAFQGAVNDVYDALLKSGYSQEQEYEADSGALMILKKAGYNPEALKVALQILEKQKSKGGWFRTHPKPTDRIIAASSNMPKGEVSVEGFKFRKARFFKAMH